MVKSNCQFDKVVLTGLTGLDDMFDRSAQIVQQTLTVPILVVNNGLSHGICHLSLASPFLFIFISSISLRIFPTVMHVLSFLHICFMIFTLTRSPFVWSNKQQDMAGLFMCCRMPIPRGHKTPQPDQWSWCLLIPSRPRGWLVYTILTVVNFWGTKPTNYVRLNVHLNFSSPARHLPAALLALA